MKKKMECSKKLAWFSGVCFAMTLLYSMIAFAYGIIVGTECDFAMLITLDTVTGAVFGVTMATYANKSRYENVIKLQTKFIVTKYKMLKELGVLDYNRAVQEVEDEISEIEEDFDNEKSMANQEITYDN
jgi:hypothetical protein